MKRIFYRFKYKILKLKKFLKYYLQHRALTLNNAYLKIGEALNLIRELEQHWNSRTLEAYLSHQVGDERSELDIFDCYRKLLHQDFERSPKLRQRNFPLLIEELERLVRSEKQRFYVHHSAKNLVAVDVPSSGISTLRYDQAYCSFRWGMTFVFRSRYGERSFAKYLVERSIRELMQDLCALRAIEQRLRRADYNPSRVVISEGQGLLMERLFLDILNEKLRIAHEAPLIEDFFEKTDLRVIYPDIRRQRGTRVQIKCTANLATHERGMNQITSRDEMVILSPVTLAKEFLMGKKAAQAISRDEFWAALPNKPADVNELAHSLRNVFESAIGRAIEHPWGPAHFVPKVIREYIQVFVHSNAVIATKTLRAKELQGVTRRQLVKKMRRTK